MGTTFCLNKWNVQLSKDCISEFYPFYLNTELQAVGYITVSILLLIWTEINEFLFL